MRTTRYLDRASVKRQNRRSQDAIERHDTGEGNARITLKISAVLRYQMVNTEKALRTVQNYLEQIHLAVQEALRTVVGAKKLDELLTQREQIVEAMKPLVVEQAERVGVKVLRVSLRDFMLSGELKQAYAETVKARLEGQASLERARGETAARRGTSRPPLTFP
jgi:regulator of protease activity HflC (stomatin/prohibitin superfamily)